MSKEIIFSIKPRFSPLTVALQLIGIGVSSAFAIAIIVEILFTVLFALFGWPLNTGGVFGIVFLISLIIVPLFLYEIRRKNKSKIGFDFYDEYVDFSYFTGIFMTRKKGRVYYSDITEMIEYSNFFQNFSQLKTIQLHAPNTSLYQRGQGFVGIQLQDIKIGKGVGKKIQALLDRQHNSQQRQAFDSEDVIVEGEEKSGTK